MDTVALVTLVGVALAVVAVALFLIMIAGTLVQVSSQLNVVLDAVGKIPAKVAPAEEVFTGINGDLVEAQGALEGLLEKKLR